jgi:hypothetical protein
MDIALDDGHEKLNFDLPMKTRASLGTVLNNIYEVADRLHDPDDHMVESICDGCYIMSELKQIRKHFNLAIEGEAIKKKRGK